MNQQTFLRVDKNLIDVIDALVLEGMFKSRSRAIKAALMGFIRTKNAERVRAIYEEFISEAISNFRR